VRALRMSKPSQAYDSQSSFSSVMVDLRRRCPLQAVPVPLDFGGRCLCRQSEWQRSAIRSKEPFDQECFHVMGNPERCASGRYMCCLGITEHIHQVLQSERCHPLTHWGWFSVQSPLPDPYKVGSLGFLVTVDIRHPVLSSASGGQEG